MIIATSIGRRQPRRRSVRGIHLALALGSALVLGACEQSEPTPPAPADAGAGSGGASSSGSGDRSIVRDDATSLPGRSARSAERAVEALQTRSGVGFQADDAAGLGFGGTVTVAGLTFTIPDDWERVEPEGSMRAAQVRVPGSGTGDGTITFITFGPGQGGSVAQNLQRWRQQVLDDLDAPAPAQIDEATIQGVKATMITIRGTLLDGMPGQTPVRRPVHALRGVIAEGPRGSVYIKYTGPEDLIDRTNDGWMSMVESLRPG